MIENDIHLIIKKPHINSEEKLIKAIETLEKALHSEHKEESPYRAYREFEKQLEQDFEDRMYHLLETICKQWLKVEPPHRLLHKALDQPYKLNGKMFLNPKTGKPLTKREWESIVKDLDVAFEAIFRDAPDLVVKQAIALGKILQSMELSDAVKISYDQVVPEIDKRLPSAFDDSVTFAEQSAGIYITSLADQARKDVITTIVDAQKNQRSSRELASDLFERFAELNRDWRRIAETELSMNFNAGYLTSELEHEEKKEKPVFMMGHSDSKACSWCRSHINGNIVVLVKDAPSDGVVEIDGVEYEAIWPGKTNVGRRQNEWWSCIPAHPHCKCVWNRYYPNLAEAHRKILERSAS